MKTAHFDLIASEINLPRKKVQAAVELLDNGATVPFIARYRKEATGSLDEVQITAIRDRINQLRELDKRRDTVLETIDKQGKLTPELKEKILAAETLSVLEDLYLPYKPKRRTRATIAKERGLEPLAELIFGQTDVDLAQEAQQYVDPEKKIASVEDALKGARDIVAEWVNENTEARSRMRELFFDEGIFQSHVVEERNPDAPNYKDYFNWQEPVKNIPSHRMLAVRRGEKEGLLALKVAVPETAALKILNELFIKADNAAAEQVLQAYEDGFKRLLAPSMETEIRLAVKERADREAIEVFAKNLRQLLMAPPLGQHAVMAIDPAFRTGCKVVCLSPQGQMLHYSTIFPVGKTEQQVQARQTIPALCQQYHIEFIAIGNGTACRETEAFVRSLDLPLEVHVLIVPEHGASVYSASDVAREEFPNHDVTVRGAVSIGRRLMDPLAELVKIDPKSIGVGQYQHDVDQKLLKQSLDDVVVSCVNLVGVELNTASKQILTYVSGLGPARAQTIIDYRNDKSVFRSREELFDVSGLGPKAIEQAAGFLRIRDSENPLDASAVHPESYHLVESMARDLTCSVRDLMQNDDIRRRIDLKKYITDAIGMPTLEDIYAELAKPGRDPRAEFTMFRFREGVEKIEDLKPGMKLPGIVTNITNFGAFVDIGVHCDGLVHISQLSEKYVKRVEDVIAMHQPVEVTVLQVDLPRRRIALSMKANPQIPAP